MTLALGGRRVRFITVAASVAVLLFSATPLAAQDISINFGQGTAGGGGLNERITQLIALLTVLSLAPSILIMMTSFTRIVVVLSLLRTATAPPNSVVISLALFLTAFVMGPVLAKVYDVGVKPLVNNGISVNEAFDRATVPLRGFMEKNVREKDLQLFVNMSGEKAPDKPEDVSMRILIPAFMISELRRAFEIGFLLFLPFLIIDLVVASVLMSMGMMMLPPVVVSLPFKLIFFVLVDGWTLVAGSLRDVKLSLRRDRGPLWRRPYAGVFKLFHRRVGEFGLGAVAADDEHQDRILAAGTRRDIFEPPDSPRRKRDDIERIEIDRFHLAGLVLPTAVPTAGHGNEGFVGVVVVHHRALARLSAAIAEVEPFGDWNCRKPRRVVADRRCDGAARSFGRLKADYVKEYPFALRRLGIRQSAVGAFEILKPRHALEHVGARKPEFRQRFHGRFSRVCGLFAVWPMPASATPA